MTAESSGIQRRRDAARDGANPGYLQRRAEIVSAAARVFQRLGLQRANLGDIALEAGADRASLYYYVGNKEELFHEVVREAVEANLARAQAIRSGDGDAPTKLTTLITALMQSYADHYPILYVFIQENLSRGPERSAAWSLEMRDINRAYEQIVVDIVTEGMDAGTLRRSGEPWVVAYGLMGMVGWTSRWFNPTSSRASAAEIGTTFADALLQGLAIPSAGRRRPRKT